MYTQVQMESVLKIHQLQFVPLDPVTEVLDLTQIGSSFAEEFN